MQDLVSQLQSGVALSSSDAQSAVAHLVGDKASETEKAGFLQALRTKGETAGEMAAFVEALLDLAIDPGIDPARLFGPLIDVCGTGGDRLELFNVSTTSMFVLAAGGAVVVKHGNRAITSKCGGADVLEALGVQIELPPADLRRCVETLGLGFVFAQAYHPAFKAIAPVRKALAAQGIPTIFNLLGPLLNPVRPAHQLVGIFAPELLPKYASAFTTLGRSRAWAVHGSGMDELSTSGPSDVVEVTPSSSRNLVVIPGDLGIAPATLDELRGGDQAQNAAILVGILDGSIIGPKRDMVLLNSAAGFVVSGLVPDLPAGLELARQQIESGRAAAKLRALQDFQ